MKCGWLNFAKSTLKSETKSNAVDLEEGSEIEEPEATVGEAENEELKQGDPSGGEWSEENGKGLSTQHHVDKMTFAMPL